MVRAAQKAKELDAQHVGMGEGYKNATDLGIASTASELSIKAKAAGYTLVGDV